MAEQEQSGQGESDQEQESFQDALVNESLQVPDVVELRGWVGRGPEGTVRIYFSRSLKKYGEVREPDILHREALPGRRTAIWVRQDAVVQIFQVESIRAELLKGGITAAFLDRTMEAMRLMYGDAAARGSRLCPTRTWCPTCDYVCHPISESFHCRTEWEYGCDGGEEPPY